jgi:hypothetical protein
MYNPILLFRLMARKHKIYSENITPRSYQSDSVGEMSLRPERKRKKGLQVP